MVSLATLMNLGAFRVRVPGAAPHAHITDIVERVNSFAEFGNEKVMLVAITFKE